MFWSGVSEQCRNTPGRGEASKQDKDGSIDRSQLRPCDLAIGNFELLAE